MKLDVSIGYVMFVCWQVIGLPMWAPKIYLGVWLGDARQCRVCMVSVILSSCLAATVPSYVHCTWHIVDRLFVV